MNKKGQQNLIIYLIIGAVIAFAVFTFVIRGEEKQLPHPADFIEEDEGTLYVRLFDEEGNEGQMLEEFYKVTGAIGSVITGTTALSCNINTDCTSICSGDVFCQDHIFCYQNTCTYGPGASGIPVSRIALDARGINTGNSVLDVTFDAATTSVASTAFDVSHSSNLGITAEVQPGTTTTFWGQPFDIVSYETGSQTTFTVALHAVDQFDGTRYPVTGSMVANVDLVISSDPTGGFTVAISQLPGI